MSRIFCVYYIEDTTIYYIDGMMLIITNVMNINNVNKVCKYM